MKDAASTADGGDHGTIPTELTIGAGQHVGTLALNIANDNIIEADETLILKALPPVGFTLNGSPIVVTIKNTTGVDPLNKINIAIALEKSSINEGETANVMASLPGDESIVASQDIVIDLTHPNTGTALNGIDYVLPNKITIPKGFHSGVLALAASTDVLYEDDETVIIKGISPDNNIYTIQGTPLTLTIKDKTDGVNPDGGIAIKLSVSSLTVDEGEQTIVSISLPEGVLAGKLISLNLSSTGTAVLSTDYMLPNVITIPVDQNSGSVTLYAIEDKLFEGDETVTLSLDISGTTYTVIGAPKVITIKDKDSITASRPLVASLSSNKVSEGEKVVLTVSLPEGIKTQNPIKVDIKPTLITASASDYKMPDYLIIGKNSNSGSVEIEAIKDGLFEVVEYLSIDLIPQNSLSIKGSPLDLSIENTDKLQVKLSIDKQGIDDKDKIATVTVVAENLEYNGSPVYLNMLLTGAEGYYITNIGAAGLPVTAANPQASFTITSTISGSLSVNALLSIGVEIIPDASYGLNLEVESNELSLIISNDFDNDGISNSVERECCVKDTDGNGILNEWDPYNPLGDDDKDGILNKDEDLNKNGNPYDDDTDGDCIPNFADKDSDNDGVPDDVEDYTDRVTDDNEGDIRVHPALSLNEDGIGNDKLFIENIEKYPDNQVTVFNRQGIIIYKQLGYDNVDRAFKGYSNQSSSSHKVPIGTYYYYIHLIKDGKPKKYSGFVEVRY